MPAVSGTSVYYTTNGTAPTSSSTLYSGPFSLTSSATVEAIAIANNSVPSANVTAAFTLQNSAPPPGGNTYYLAPATAGGSDSNNGTSSATPWLTPNHAVNCGDVILAAAGNYSATDFSYGKWGPVTCASGNNVAWLKCVTFDACKFTANGSYVAMAVTQSYWGVQGWEVTAIGDTDACFTAYPTNGTEIHHIVFANNVANGCYYSGFQSGNNGAAGVDYLVIVGNIVYNASQTSVACVSGIDIYQPVQSDSLPGTHIYIAGNFSWGNFEPNPCAGGAPTDGEGALIDTPDGRNSGLTPYAAQILIDNNILIANGGRGFEIGDNTAGAAHANVYVRHNTSWGNNGDLNQNDPYCGELVIFASQNVQEFLNIAVTNATNGCGANPMYPYYVADGNGTDSVYSNVGYSASGTNSGVTGSSGFSFGPNNLFGTNPGFVNAMAPGSPSCGSSSSVPNCMATVIANFTPTASAARSYGYQVPSTAQSYDPLFPQWLCNANLPPGLITMGCLAAAAPAPAPPAPPTNVTATIQ
jgi:hypothetical protein